MVIYLGLNSVHANPIQPGTRQCRLVLLVAVGSAKSTSGSRWVEIETALRANSYIFQKRCIHVVVDTELPFDPSLYSDHVTYRSGQPTYKDLFLYANEYIEPGFLYILLYTYICRH